MAKSASSAEASNPAAAQVHLVWGSDEFAVAATARKLIDHICPADQQALGLETIDGFCDSVDTAVAAIRNCISAVQTVGFFGATKLVWLRDASFLSDDKPGKFEDVKEKVAELTEEIKGGLLKGQYLVITSGKVHRGKAFFKACQAAGMVHEFNVPEKSYESESRARDIAAAAFADAKLTISHGVMQDFLRRCGTDTRQIMQEVEKLDLSLAARREVTQDDVQLLVSPSREALIWDLTDAFGKRDLTAAVGMLRQLLGQKENPVGMIISLENRVRDLIFLRDCLDRKWARIAGGEWKRTVEWSVPPEGELMMANLAGDPRKQHPYRVFLLTDQAQKFTMGELVRCHRALVETHEAMVSGSVEDDVLLELMLIRSMGGRRRAA